MKTLEKTLIALLLTLGLTATTYTVPDSKNSNLSLYLAVKLN